MMPSMPDVPPMKSNEMSPCSSRLIFVKDILSFPSGLYTSGDLVIMRQKGIGFLIMEETHHNWVELRRYDEAGLLTEVTYERA